MKKLIELLIVLLLFGCNFSNTPSSVVERYLDDYINLSDDVIMDLETSVAGENLSVKNKEAYKRVLSREYENLKYEIKDESINGDKATVIAKISVYDLYKVEEYTNNYMKEHINEFMNNSEFDKELYNTFRIGEMLKTNEIVDYDITFKLTKVNDEWILDNPSSETIEKIHGMYDYKND